MQGKQALRWVVAGCLVFSATGCDDAADNARTDTGTNPDTYAGTHAASSTAKVADIDLSLVRANLCLACHQVDRQLVGPSFQAIAQRYAGRSGAQDSLVQSIRNGGQGRWGALTMPKQPQVSQADAHKLAQWLLSLAADQTKLTDHPSTP